MDTQTWFILIFLGTFIIIPLFIKNRKQRLQSDLPDTFTFRYFHKDNGIAIDMTNRKLFIASENITDTFPFERISHLSAAQNTYTYEYTGSQGNTLHDTGVSAFISIVIAPEDNPDVITTEKRVIINIPTGSDAEKLEEVFRRAREGTLSPKITTV